MTDHQATVSIVIPAFNEAQRLPRTLEAIQEFANGRPWITQVIIVDDGSSDATGSVASAAQQSDPRFQLVTYRRNSGKGYAVRRGVMAATADTILVSDADLSTPITELEKLLRHLESADVVIGSRAVDESSVRVRQRWYRQRMGKIFNAIVATITGLPFRDTQCGFKLLTTAAARDIFREATIDRFAWDVEMLLIARKLGFAVAEVPVLWFNSPDSKVRVIRDSSRMFFDTVRIRLRLGKLHPAREK